MIRILETPEEIRQAENHGSGLCKEFIDGLTAQPSQKLVTNVQTQIGAVQLDGVIMPFTKNELEYQNSYVCSPYTGMISYAMEELKHIQSIGLRGGLRILAGGMSPILKVARVNQVVCVNNAMFSTNLYPGWDGNGIAKLTDELTSRFENHVVMFRSLNNANNPKLCSTLTNAGYSLIPSRLLYVLDPRDKTVPNKRNNKIDFRRLRETSLQLVEPDQFFPEDDAVIRSLYDQLYLEKYSRFNPQFTDEFIRLLRSTGQVQFMGFRTEAGTLVGAIGVLEVNKQLATPIVGYDFSMEQGDALYRMLTALGIQRALREAKLFNMSSGVGKFKRHRGAKPLLEYSAIYTRHLSLPKRTLWGALGTIMSRIVAPLVERYEI